MTKPLLSVILPAFNAERYLELAVRSVLQQSFKNFELIVIDDGSTDRTAQILRKVDDCRLHVISHNSNLGLIAGLNEGINVSSGRYIARMDADDLCMPSRFQRQIEFLEKSPEIGVLGTAIELIDDQGTRGSIYVMPVTSADVEWSMPLMCPLAHPSVMMRTDLVRRADGYSVKALHAEDYDLWHRLSSMTTVANLRDPLLQLRKHGSSVTATLRDLHLDAAAAVAQADLLRRLDEDVPISVIRCLRSWGKTDSEHAMKVVDLLIRLLALLRSSHSEGSTKVACRDAAVRILYLARYVTGLERVQVIRAAHNVYPFAGAAIVQKYIQRVMPGVSRKLIG